MPWVWLGPAEYLLRFASAPFHTGTVLYHVCCGSVPMLQLHYCSDSCRSAHGTAYPPGLPQDWLLADPVDEAGSMAMSAAATMLLAAEAPAQGDFLCSTSCVSTRHETVVQVFAPYLILPGGTQLLEQGMPISVQLSKPA